MTAMNDTSLPAIILSIDVFYVHVYLVFRRYLLRSWILSYVIVQTGGVQL